MASGQGEGGGGEGGGEKGRGELASPSSVLEIIYFTQRISYNIALKTDCDAPKPFGVQHSVHVTCRLCKQGIYTMLWSPNSAHKCGQ